MSILYSIIIGAICGWLAGNIMKGDGFGLIVNIILGIVGGIVGNFLFNTLGISIGSGVINDILTGLAGSAVVLFIASFFSK